MSYGKISHEVTYVECVKGGANYRITISIPLSYGWIERVKFVVSNEGGKTPFQLQHKRNTEEFAEFEGMITLPVSAIYHYYFSFEANGRFQYYKKRYLTGEMTISKEECWKLSVGFKVPDWAKGAIMYHIFVDRYRKSNEERLIPMDKREIHEDWYENPILGPSKSGEWNIDFFGGNLKGIEESLKYIKSLGVSIIYLSPVCWSQSNHRYDTADYENVDPYAGTNEALKQLCKSAHRKGMYIILDAVFNHTGNDSKYFNEYGTFDTVGAYQSENSPYYSFYKKYWSNNRKGFAYWWGMTNLPECDGNSKEWKSYILGEGGIIDQWFELGIDGLRLDVADELTDEFIEGIRNAVHRNKEDGFVLGEVWKNPMRMNRGYVSSGKGMDSVMNYLLVDGLIRYYKYCDIEKLNRIFNEILTEYPTDTINTLMNFTSTHDISRAIEIFGCDVFQKYGEWGWDLLNSDLEWVKNHQMTADEYKYGKVVMKSYISTITFLPGIVSIFYGDEVGVKGIGNLRNRATYPWLRRDKDLLKFFRQAGKIRNKYIFLKNAETRVIQINCHQLVFERYDSENAILVISSRSHHVTDVELPDEYRNAVPIYALSGCTKQKLAPYGVIALKK